MLEDKVQRFVVDIYLCDVFLVLNAPVACEGLLQLQMPNNSSPVSPLIVHPAVGAPGPRAAGIPSPVCLQSSFSAGTGAALLLSCVPLVLPPVLHSFSFLFLARWLSDDYSVLFLYMQLLLFVWLLASFCWASVALNLSAIRDAPSFLSSWQKHTLPLSGRPYLTTSHKESCAFFIKRPDLVRLFETIQEFIPRVGNVLRDIIAYDARKHSAHTNFLP